MKFLDLFRNTEFVLHNEESQSSLQSSTSATIEGTAKKIRSKIEVADPEGYVEFTIDLLVNDQNVGFIYTPLIISYTTFRFRNNTGTDQVVSFIIFILEKLNSPLI